MKTEERALEALDCFYNSGYNQIKNQNNKDVIKIENFFISDCGVLFIRSLNNNHILGLNLK